MKAEMAYECGREGEEEEEETAAAEEEEGVNMEPP